MRGRNLTFTDCLLCSTHRVGDLKCVIHLILIMKCQSSWDYPWSVFILLTLHVHIQSTHVSISSLTWRPLSELTQTFLHFSTSIWPMENLRYFQDPPAHPTSPQPLNSNMVYLSKWQWNQLQGSVSFFQIATPHAFFFNETLPVAFMVLRLECRCLKGTLPRLLLCSLPS